MKLSWILVVILTTLGAAAQNENTKRPCIAFSPESTSPANELAKEPLETAVMQSGDFEFYPNRHDGCWVVHVISLPVTNAKGKNLGYAISETVTVPENIEVGHALTFGPDQDIFVRAMRKAAADAIRNIRLARGISESQDRSTNLHEHLPKARLLFLPVMRQCTGMKNANHGRSES